MYKQLELNVEEFQKLVCKYIEANYVFRELQIFDYFGNPRINYAHRKWRNNLEEIDNTTNPFNLLRRHEFEDWQILNKNTVSKVFWDEFRISNLEYKIRLKDKLIFIDIANKLITRELCQTIEFDSRIKDLINSKRISVKGIKINGYSDDRNRKEIDVKIGETYFICKSHTQPHIANPCYVFDKNDCGETINVIYFTNVVDYFTESNKLEINGWCFDTVYKNELGKTPEEAVYNFRL